MDATTLFIHPTNVGNLRSIGPTYKRVSGDNSIYITTRISSKARHLSCLCIRN
jgi:hypothetical protein